MFFYFFSCEKAEPAQVTASCSACSTGCTPIGSSLSSLHGEERCRETTRTFSLVNTTSLHSLPNRDYKYSVSIKYSYIKLDSGLGLFCLLCVFAFCFFESGLRRIGSLISQLMGCYQLRSPQWCMVASGLQHGGASLSISDP